MAKQTLISAKGIALISALCLAALPGSALAEGQDAVSQDSVKQDSITRGRAETGGSYGDQNRGGSRGFYSYPRHRHVDAGGVGIYRRHMPRYDTGTSPYSRNTHGSAYYGRNYGAPYFGGGYYDHGVYYRERRD